MTAELVEFLRARESEREQGARAANGWSTGWEAVIPRPSFPAPPTIEARDGGVPGEVYAAEDAVHIARHDPARVLREVEAKRRVVQQYVDAVREEQELDPGDNEMGWVLDRLVAELARVLRSLAAVYADHPDYRASEWASDR